MAVDIRQMCKEDVPVARHIFSLAFGTWIGAANPALYKSDCDFIGSRLQVDPEAAFVAEIDGEVVGSNFANRWGSIGFIGPLTIRPDLWDKGLGKKLMAPAVECLDRWKLTLSGLYTFSQSTKHIHLYQQFGFWSAYLTAIMSKQVMETAELVNWSGFSSMTRQIQKISVSECAELTNSIYPGLRLDTEIHSVARQQLGETVIVRKAGEIAGFAVCHCGTDTEAGDGKCFIKFAAVRAAHDSPKRFQQLLLACEALAASQGLTRLVAGINLSRHEAYQLMLASGFRSDIQGVAMHRPNNAGYSRKGVFVIDDWR